MSHTSFFTSDLSGFDLVTTLHSIVIYKGLFTWLMRMALVTTLHSIVIYKGSGQQQLHSALVTTLHSIVIYKV